MSHIDIVIFQIDTDTFISWSSSKTMLSLPISLSHLKVIF